jgi:hypothetical protein
MIDPHRGQAKKGEKPSRHPGDDPKNSKDIRKIPETTRKDPERKREELISIA